MIGGLIKNLFDASLKPYFITSHGPCGGYNIVIGTTNRGKTLRDNGGLEVVKMGAPRNRYSTVPSAK